MKTKAINDCEANPAASERVILPRKGLAGIDLAELWRYRELFGFLTWRDILIRYKQTAVGIAWAVIRPVMTMIVFTVIFGRWAKLPSNGVPYPLLTFAALLPWQFFANSLAESSGSVVASAGMIGKIYFPRLIIPFAAVVSGMVEFLISCVILAGLMAGYRVPVTAAILWLPLFLILALLCALGIGLWFSALNVEYRDVRYIIPFLVQFGLYVSPVGFSSSIVPAKWRLLYSLNPMVGVIDGFRWALLGMKNGLYLPGLYLSSLIALVLFVSGVFYFKYMERTFADVI
jgi:lipopolysaccharide transport system permease protein